MTEWVVVVIVYLVGGFVLWRTWPLVKQFPSDVAASLDRWVYRTNLEIEERKFLKAYAKAQTGAEQKRLVIAQLRLHLTAMGLDVSDFPDEEIEAACERFGRAMAETALSVDEASRNLAAALCRRET